LKDSDDTTRRLITKALSNIGAPDKADIPFLREALKDSINLEVRIYAAEALGLIGPKAQSAAADLVKALEDRDALVRQNAARSLGQIDADRTTVPALAKALEDKEQGVRIAAAESLTTARTLAARDIAFLLKVLKHQDAQARALAARALGDLGSQAKEALDKLIDASKASEEIQVRRAAIMALAKFGADAQKAIPELIGTMKKEADLREFAAQALARMGPAAKPAVLVLAEALGDENRNTRNYSLTALANLGKDAKQAVPALGKALEERDKGMRLRILSVLLKIGKDARAATSNLVSLLDEYEDKLGTKMEDKELLTETAKVLGKIGQPAVEPLKRALADPDLTKFWVRLGAVTALGNIGPEVLKVRGAYTLILNHAQKDPNQKVRQEATRALQKIQAKKKSGTGY
jgi:HEAT repeat protein